jgi:hypothetical protein
LKGGWTVGRECDLIMATPQEVNLERKRKERSIVETQVSRRERERESFRDEIRHAKCLDS